MLDFVSSIKKPPHPIIWTGGTYAAKGHSTPSTFYSPLSIKARTNPIQKYVRLIIRIFFY